MNRFTPAEKLMQGIARVNELKTLATEAGPTAPAALGEVFAEIGQLALEALLILNSLRGQIGAAP
jgi:hypothetical protein